MTTQTLDSTKTEGFAATLRGQLIRPGDPRNMKRRGAGSGTR